MKLGAIGFSAMMHGYMAFDKEEPVKEEIVQIIQAYLPNFEHIETGRSLDHKM